jgi:hypothetical protein
MAIMDGIVRKDCGNLNTVHVTEEEGRVIEKKRNLEWSDVTIELVDRRKGIMEAFYVRRT